MEQELVQILQVMENGFLASREALRSVKLDQQTLNEENGISLLSLKHHTLLSYLQSLTLIAARRVLGSTFDIRSPPPQPFGSQDRASRGNHLGDLVDLTIENRLILEKAELMESKMRYQITKLIRLADESMRHETIVDDPLAFKPNPSSLVPEDLALPEGQIASGQASAEDELDEGVYRPPRLAPVPYIEPSKNRRRERRPLVPAALATLPTDPSQPFVESSTGLGGTPALGSNRAEHLKKLKEFEEENFTRVVMKKSEAKRRARDEEDLALGGDLAAGIGPRGRRRAGGLEDEFGEVLRSVSRSGRGLAQGDGYEELRKRGKKLAILERSRLESKKRVASPIEDKLDFQRQKKRSRFELETKASKKRLGRR